MFSAALAAMLATVPFAATAATVGPVGPGGFNDGWATTITYDDSAARGTTDDRDNPLNALGAANGSFFEIGLGSTVDLTFGTFFDTSTTVFEITFGNVQSWPESAQVIVINDVTNTSLALGVITNLAAQGGVVVPIASGIFNIVRLTDTSSPIDNATTGGFDLDAVRVTPVPLPAALPLFAGGLGFLGWMARRRRKQAAQAIC